VSANDIARHAEGIHALLDTLGPRPRESIVSVLHALELSVEEAEQVIAHGIAQGKFAIDPAAPSLLHALRR
jgi:hypothetical protein